MIKYTVFFIGLVFWCFTNAQEIERKTYTEAIDYCGCLMAFSYTEHYALNNPNKKERKAFDDVLKSKLEPCKKNIVVPRGTLIPLLFENENRSFAPKLESLMITADSTFSEEVRPKEAAQLIVDVLLADGTVLNEYFSPFPDSISALENRLKAGLEMYYFPEDTPVGSILAPSGSDQRGGGNPTVQEEASNESFGELFGVYGYPLFLAFLMGGIVFVALYYNQKKEFKGLKVKVYQKNAQQWESFLKNPLKNTTENSGIEYRDDIAKLDKRIADLEDRIAKNATKDKEKPEKILESKEQSLPSQAAKLEPKPKVYYASRPNLDGSFPVSVLSEEPGENMFFKFIIHPSKPNEARFEFVNSKKGIVKSTRNPDEILYPVCKALNELDQEAEKITTEKQGFALREGDRWVIEEKNKAHIRYE